MKLNDKSYKDEFSNYSAIIAEALSKEDIKSYEVASEMLAEAVEDYKKKVVLMEEMDRENDGAVQLRGPFYYVLYCVHGIVRDLEV